MALAVTLVLSVTLDVMAESRSAYSSLETSAMFFRPCTPEDIPVVAEIESNSYPPDEAASPENLAYRQTHAGAFFLVGIQVRAPAVCVRVPAVSCAKP